MKDSKVAEENKVEKTQTEEPTDQFYGKQANPPFNIEIYRDEKVSCSS